MTNCFARADLAESWGSRHPEAAELASVLRRLRKRLEKEERAATTEGHMDIALDCKGVRLFVECVSFRSDTAYEHRLWGIRSRVRENASCAFLGGLGLGVYRAFVQKISHELCQSRKRGCSPVLTA